MPECQLEDGGAKSIITSEREGSIFSTSLNHGVCNGYIIPDGPKNPTLYLQRESVNVTEMRCDASSLQEENGRSRRRGDNDKLYSTITAEQMDQEPWLLYACSELSRCKRAANTFNLFR